MADIKFKFVNNSNDSHNSRIVLFQRNRAFDNSEVTAWNVIENVGPGQSHRFTFPAAIEVSAADGWGNFTPPMKAPTGRRFVMELDDTGCILTDAGPCAEPAEIRVVNHLAKGAISASLYRGAWLLHHERDLAPRQTAVFHIDAELFIGATTLNVMQGAVLEADIVDEINTGLNLTDLASADIVMTGGGGGPEAQPLSFALANIVEAKRPVARQR